MTPIQLQQKLRQQAAKAAKNAAGVSSAVCKGSSI